MRATGGQEVTSVRQELELWRKRHGGKGRRIPGELWKRAARVARTVGVRETARALRLYYKRLQGRVEVSRSAGGRAGRPTPSTFVALPMGLLGDGRTMVELVGRGGEQMRIHLAGASAADVVRLAEAFWSRQS